MKKLLLVFALAIVTLSARAQVYVGGSLNFAAANQAAQVSIIPEVGYAFNDNMAVGMTLGYANDESITWLEGASVVIAPYFRYTFLNAGPVRLFADAEFQLGIIDEGKQTATAWNLGIRPGLALPVTEHLSFVGHIGRLGYYNNTFTFGVNGNTFTAGVYYSF